MTQVTFYGHSSFLVEVNGLKILFDPFISGNEAASDIKVEDINPDVILVTHGHQDHILDVETIAKQSGAKLISNYEIVTYYQNKGIENAHPVNHGGSVDVGRGVKVKYVNAVHTSSFPDGSYAGQPGGFVISRGDASFYYSGDTALHYDMKLIGDAGGVDFAFLCLGDNFTMGYEDAIKAATFVDTKKVIGMHFDTFPPIEIDQEAVKKSFEEAGLSLTLPSIGETFSV